MKMLLQIIQQCIVICSLLIHLIDKQECRNLISLQKSLQSHRMALHTVHSIDHQNRIIEDLQRTFHFS